MSRTKMFVARDTGGLLMFHTFEGAWGFAPRIVDILSDEWDLKRPDILDVLMPFEANVLEMTLPGRYIQGHRDIQRYCSSLLRFSETYTVASGDTCMFKDIVEVLNKNYSQDTEFVAFQLSDNTSNPWQVKTEPPEGGSEASYVTWVREYNLVTDKCPLRNSDVVPQRAHMRHVPERVQSLYEVGMAAAGPLKSEKGLHVSDIFEQRDLASKAFKEAVKELKPSNEDSFETIVAHSKAKRKRIGNIQPLVRKEGKLWTTNRSSLVPSCAKNLMTESLRAIAELKTIHPYSYYGFFQPEIDEVVRCIPDYLLSQVDFFEVQGPNTVHDMNREHIAFNAGYQVAFTTLYAKVVNLDAYSPSTRTKSL